ncbi:MAG: tetrahydrofolate dehydrogenase/cyclohydrolase catalytic domain-containing protein [Patescibacteria group bacterium]|nr:tetrahydrofolate dehydrogenase/cyclohydrolase catalytic domain-containing protein [Patescibacteria group bacterium]
MPETNIIDGRKVAGRIEKETRREIAALGFEPGLGVILVGDDPASHLYVKLKQKACERVGIRFELSPFAADATEENILDNIRNLNKRDDIHAILVQLPLPKNMDTDRVIRAMDPAKDVDGFHPDNIKRLDDTDGDGFPGLTEGVIDLIHETGVDLNMKRVVIAANSPTFVLPLEMRLRQLQALPKFVHGDAPDITSQFHDADIIITALGRPGLVTEDDIKEGAILIDVGTTKVGKKTIGDVDTESVRGKASWLTPVPGGVGPVTVAMLLKNVVRLSKDRA